MNSRRDRLFLRVGRFFFRRRGSKATVATSRIEGADSSRYRGWEWLGPTAEQQRAELSRSPGNDARRRSIAAAFALAVVAAVLYVWGTW